MEICPQIGHKLLVLFENQFPSSLPVLYEPEHRDGYVHDERVAVQAYQLQEGQRGQLRRPPQESGEKAVI